MSSPLQAIEILKLQLIAYACCCLASVHSMAQSSTDPSIQPGEVIQSLERTFGVHPGERRNHIKGTCAQGVFVGKAAESELSRSALFSGEAVPVIARFSLAGGNPNLPDSARNARGLALEFRLPSGERQHMTMLNTPVFGADRPETFNDLILASQPDPATGKPDPVKIATAIASHPDALAQTEFLAHNLPPANFANATFYSIHTFKFVDAANVSHLVKWRFVPHDGGRPLSPAELAVAPHDFLQHRLIDRAAMGPVKWDMWVYQSEPGDVPANASIAWPESRQHRVAGTLSITAASPQKGAECERINFDPLVMADGIEPTNDPILLFRSPAYAISFSKRLTGQ